MKTIACKRLLFTVATLLCAMLLVAPVFAWAEGPASNDPASGESASADSPIAVTLTTYIELSDGSKTRAAEIEYGDASSIKQFGCNWSNNAVKGKLVLPDLSTCGTKTVECKPLVDGVEVDKNSADFTSKYNLTENFATLTVKPAALKESDIESIADAMYTGGPVAPTVKVRHNGRLLKAGQDYTASYADNVNAGKATVTVSGKGNYTGSVSRQFAIDPKQVSLKLAFNRHTTYFSAPPFAISATAEKGAKVAYVSKNTLVATVDANGRVTPRNAGKCTVVVKAAALDSNFVSSQESFEVVVGRLGIGYCSVLMPYSKATYSGSQKKPAPIVSRGGDDLRAGIDYQVTYSGGKNVGPAKVKIVGCGNLTGSTTKTFTVFPKATTLSKCKSAKRAFRAYWKKMASGNASGYELRYSLSSSMSKAKTVKVAGASTSSKTIKKLKAGKKYYVQVRCYKSVSGKTYRSSWSKAKKVKAGK